MQVVRTETNYLDGLPPEDQAIIMAELKTLSPALIAIMKQMGKNYIEAVNENTELKTDLKAVKDGAIEVMEYMGMYEDGEIKNLGGGGMVGLTLLVSKMPALLKAVQNGTLTSMDALKNIAIKYQHL